MSAPPQHKHHIEAEHDVFDARWSEALEQGGCKSVCKAGCSWCCSEPVLVQVEEVQFLVDKIPPAELEGVKERLRAWLARAKASGVWRQSYPNVIQYRALKLVCPLLKDNLCLVYKDRPMPCRAHTALLNPKLCADDATRPQQHFAFAEELTTETVFNIARLRGVIEADQLGLLLAKELLGEEYHSVDHMQQMVPNEIVNKIYFDV